MCAFSLVVDRDLLKDTHTDDVKSSGLVFMPPNPSINNLLYCIKQIITFFRVCVCTVINHGRRYNV